MKLQRVLFPLALFTIAPHAYADEPAEGPDKMACIEAHGQSQVLRRDEKLIQARERLVTCSNASCPGVIQDECGQWLTEIDRAIPTVVFEAHRDGAELIEVQVLVDGSVRAEKLDGKPLTINPGIHQFRYELEGAAPIEQQLTIHAGEKNRRIDVKFPSTKPLAPEVAADVHAAETPAQGAVRVPTTAYVLGGVGVAALGAFTYFGLSGNGKKSDLDACKGHCADADVQAVRRDWTIANIALGVGVVSLGVATYFVLSSGSSASSPPADDTALVPTIDVVATGNGGAVTLRSRF